MRFTKIVCTIGPSSETDETITELIKAGMDVARLNMSFGTQDYHRSLIEKIRENSEKMRKHVAVLVDLSGVKARIGELESPLTLHMGQRVILASREDRNGAIIPVNNPEILKHMHKGDTVFLADGSIKLRIISEGENEVKAEVVEGGHLTSYKGISFSGKLKMGPITEKDVRDIEFGIKHGVDWIAMSFVKSAGDVLDLKEVISGKGADIPVIAKIERREAVENLKEIIQVADGIMVARGDLGVEMPVEEIPIIQKEIIRIANRFCKPVITATQMLKSMVVSATPTRAEVTDVANAVLDGSDALMLSEETASGNFPVEAVRVMDRIIRKAESIYPYMRPFPAESISQSIAGSAAKIAAEIRVEAILCLTRTGSSAIQISRYRPPVPVMAATHSQEVLRRLSLVWGCIPVVSVSRKSDLDRALAQAVRESIKRGYLKMDSSIVVTSGIPFGEPGTTNSIRILKAEDVISGIDESQKLY